MSRKFTTTAVFLCLLLSAPAFSQLVNPCVPFFINERVAFDLTSIDAAIGGATYNISFPPFTNPKTKSLETNAKVEFRACGIAQRPANCPETPGGAFSYYFSNNICFPQIVPLSSQVKEVININSKVNGVALSYNNDKLTEEQKKGVGPNLRYRITCNKDITGAPKWSHTTEGEYIVLSTEHSSGCPKNLDDFLELVKMYKWIFGLIFVAIGVIFAFFGRHAYKWTLMLTGFVLGFFVVAIISYSFGIFHNSSDGLKWGILAVSLLVGLIVGFLLYKLETMTVMLVCGVLSSLIFMAIMSTFFANNNMDKWLLLALTIAVGFIGGALGACFKE